MKKRINRLFVIISVVAIVLSIGLVAAVYHSLFRKQMMSDLKEYADLLKELRWDEGAEEPEYFETMKTI